jgi:hypothetical protein
MTKSEICFPRFFKSILTTYVTEMLRIVETKPRRTHCNCTSVNSRRMSDQDIPKYYV